MSKRAVTFTAVREYMRPRSRSHIARSRGRYVGPVFGMGVPSTLCGLPAGVKITGLPADKVSCSDCRAIYRSTAERVS